MGECCSICLSRNDVREIVRQEISRELRTFFGVNFRSEIQLVVNGFKRVQNSFSLISSDLNAVKVTLNTIRLNFGGGREDTFPVSSERFYNALSAMENRIKNTFKNDLKHFGSSIRKDIKQYLKESDNNVVNVFKNDIRAFGVSIRNDINLYLNNQSNYIINVFKNDIRAFGVSIRNDFRLYLNNQSNYIINVFKNDIRAFGVSIRNDIQVYLGRQVNTIENKLRNIIGIYIRELKEYIASLINRIRIDRDGRDRGYYPSPTPTPTPRPSTECRANVYYTYIDTELRIIRATLSTLISITNSLNTKIELCFSKINSIYNIVLDIKNRKTDGGRTISPIVNIDFSPVISLINDIKNSLSVSISGILRIVNDINLKIGLPQVNLSVDIHNVKTRINEIAVNIQNIITSTRSIDFKIDTRLANIITLIGTLNATVNVQLQKINEIKIILNRIENKLPDNFGTDCNTQIVNNILQIKSDIAIIKKDITSIKNEINQIENEIEISVTNILNQKISQLQLSITAVIQNEFVKLNNTIDNSRVFIVNTIKQDLDIRINTLVRAIEQKIEIESIKIRNNIISAKQELNAEISLSRQEIINNIRLAKVTIITSLKEIETKIRSLEIDITVIKTNVSTILSRILELVNIANSIQNQTTQINNQVLRILTSVQEILQLLRNLDTRIRVLEINDLSQLVKRIEQKIGVLLSEVSQIENKIQNSKVGILNRIDQCQNSLEQNIPYRVRPVVDQSIVTATPTIARSIVDPVVQSTQGIIGSIVPFIVRTVVYEIVSNAVNEIINNLKDFLEEKFNDMKIDLEIHCRGGGGGGCTFTQTPRQLFAPDQESFTKSVYGIAEVTTKDPKTRNIRKHYVSRELFSVVIDPKTTPFWINEFKVEVLNYIQHVVHNQQRICNYLESIFQVLGGRERFIRKHQNPRLDDIVVVQSVEEEQEQEEWTSIINNLGIENIAQGLTISENPKDIIAYGLMRLFALPEYSFEQNNYKRNRISQYTSAISPGLNSIVTSGIEFMYPGRIEYNNIYLSDSLVYPDGKPRSITPQENIRLWLRRYLDINNITSTDPTKRKTPIAYITNWPDFLEVYMSFLSFREGILDYPVKVIEDFSLSEEEIREKLNKPKDWKLEQLNEQDEESLMINLDNKVEQLMWMFKNLLEIIGITPYKIEIAKDHPLLIEYDLDVKENKKTFSLDSFSIDREKTLFKYKLIKREAKEDQIIEIRNIAEATKEILVSLLTLQTAEKLGKELSIRNLLEIASTRNTVINIWTVVEVILAYLGIPYNEEKDSYWLSFSPPRAKQGEEEEEVEDMLNPKEIFFKRLKYDGDPRSTLYENIRFITNVCMMIKTYLWEDVIPTTISDEEWLKQKPEGVSDEEWLNQKPTKREYTKEKLKKSIKMYDDILSLLADVYKQTDGDEETRFMKFLKHVVNAWKDFKGGIHKTEVNEDQRPRIVYYDKNGQKHIID